MKKPAKKHFTITEAARKLGITRSGVHEAIRRGTLDYEWGELVQVVKIRKRAKLIPADKLEAYRVSMSHQQRGKKPA